MKIWEDMDGRIVVHISENMSFYSIYLDWAFEAMIKKYNHSVDELINYIFKSPLFTEERKEIYSLGINLYLNNQYLQSAHLLVPQVEYSLRTLMKINRQQLFKINRVDGYQLKNFDEILNNEVVIETLGKDIIKYLKVLYTDQRGWNLRNDLCHGEIPPKLFNKMHADRIIHSILILAQVRYEEANQSSNN